MAAKEIYRIDRTSMTSVYCDVCGVEGLFILGTACPSCVMRGILSTMLPTLHNHSYVEDVIINGLPAVTITRSVMPLPGKHCAIHMKKED